ncbi:hypothetical protein BH20ACT2_BH20ACT2_03830 [soil metagenome]
MEWLLGAALLPLLVCGLMCAGGVLLATVGLRRSQPSGRDSCSTDQDSETPHDHEARGVEV